jgi:hypothetical protein
MKIKELRVHFHTKEPACLTAWVDCDNARDVQVLIEVLTIARAAMIEWDNVEDKVE